MAMPELKRARTRVLEIAYEESGPAGGAPIFLMHGYPYDPRCYDQVAPRLAASGWRCIVPYLRGYGPTRFLDARTMRSGQQGALGQDLLDLMDALGIRQAALAGYDWGGRAACIVAALWPERARFLVTVNGYNIQNIAGAAQPAEPEREYRLWYQYYFATERGRAGLAANRKAMGKLLWRLWSPSWRLDEALYERTALSFDNPDFVEVVIHSYRHRYGTVPGDTAYEAIERGLAAQPPITVPAIALDGADDGVHPPTETAGHGKRFTGRFARRVLPGIGHCPPQECPEIFVDAVLDLAGGRV